MLGRDFPGIASDETSPHPPGLLRKFVQRELGHQIGRFKVHSLMKKAGLYPNNQGPIAIRLLGLNDQIFLYLLTRDVDVQQPNLVWYGDITYVWAGGR